MSKHTKKNRKGSYQERTDIFEQSVEFLAITARIIDTIPNGRTAIATRLKHAAFSVSVNIEKGGGDIPLDEKQKFYTIARDSAMECRAIMDVCKMLQLIDKKTLNLGKNILTQIIRIASEKCENE